ncbi:TIGR04104 family putative zinc finger protein [Planococcus sp. YIM B11945]|uniref:TIGR04104 family putative zinc finger protein n=1 Tax=Planococcus sp. YIM B11945 TaxID=3435410 RepID=UPI003D7C80DF
MPTCQNCGHQWSWKETFKKSFTLSNGMRCPSCGAKQYATKRSRTRMSLFTFIFSPLLILLAFFFDLTIGTLMLIAIPLFAVVLIIYPFLYEFSNEEEPMW